MTKTPVTYKETLQGIVERTDFVHAVKEATATNDLRLLAELVQAK